MPARLDIALQRNEGWARSLTITDDKGEAIDLTGMTLAMQVRDKLSQDLITEALIQIVDATAGEVLIEIEGGEGSSLSSFGDPIQTINLHHDLLMTDEAGASVILFAGILILSRGETRA